MTTPPRTLRRALPTDAAELTRLRAEMFRAMSVPGVDDPAWQRACRAHFAGRVSEADFVALVVDAEPVERAGDGGPLLASGCAWLDRHLPGPSSTTGLRGHIASVCTDAIARRQGLARAVFAGLLDWLREQNVATVDLHASPAGRPLYEQFGFAGPRNTAMSLRLR